VNITRSVNKEQVWCIRCKHTVLSGINFKSRRL